MLLSAPAVTRNVQSAWSASSGEPFSTTMPVVLNIHCRRVVEMSPLTIVD